MTLTSGEVEEEVLPPRASPDKAPSGDGLPTMQATLLTGRDGLPLSSTSPAIPLATVANEEVLPRGAGALEAAWAGAALEAASRGPGPSSISFQASGLNAVAVESPGSDAGSARVRTRTRTRRSRSRSDSSPSPSPRSRCQDGGAPDASSVAPSVRCAKTKSARRTKRGAFASFSARRLRLPNRLQAVSPTTCRSTSAACTTKGCVKASRAVK